MAVSPAFSDALPLGAREALRSVSWDGARVMKCPGEEHSPAIWLGDVGQLQGAANVDWALGCIDPFVSGASETFRSHDGRRRPVLAINVLGTGEGGLSDERGEVSKGLLPELYKAANTYNSDLVLVCWGRRALSAAQRIRRQYVDDPSDGRALWELGPNAPQLCATAKRLAEHARIERLVLFLGAGISTGVGLPLWTDLLNRVGEKLDLNPEEGRALQGLHPLDQAEYLRMWAAEPPSKLEELVADELKSERYTISHALLASLPWKEAVTTNFDNLFERASKSVDRELAVLPYETVRPGVDRWLLKLHGSVSQKGTMILSRSDYLSAPATHGALFALVQAMLMTRHMLFVGYSLKDDDFHQLFHEVRAARQDAKSTEPMGTVITLFANPLIAKLRGKDLETVAVSEVKEGTASPKQMAEAERWLTIFLDLLAFESADLSQFLLDRTYAAAFDDGERKLVELLRPVESFVAHDRGAASGVVRELLTRLGSGHELRP